MKIANYGVPGTLEPFTVPASADNYWQELAAYVWVKTLWNKSQAGMQIVEVEESDVQTVQTDITNALNTSIAAIDALYPGGQTS